MLLSLPCLVTAFVALAAAKPIPESHVVHERRGLLHHTTANKWAKRERVDKDSVLPVRIGLKQQNLHKGPEWLMDV